MNNQEFVNCPTIRDIHDHFSIQLTELNIKPRTENDAHELFIILNQYLSYPDDELANNHRLANKLGFLDLTRDERERMAKYEEDLDAHIKQNVRQTHLIKAQSETCRCCGFFVQRQDISSCQSEMEHIIHLGTATRVFFKTFIFLAILFTIMLFVYSIFAFTTNIIVAKNSDYLRTTNSGLDYLSISLGAKSNIKVGVNEDGQYYYLVSSWLGLAMLVIWVIVFIWIKKAIGRMQIRQRQHLSVSDFSIVIENMPTDVKKQDLENQLNNYLRQKKTEYENGLWRSVTKIEIVKYNQGKPFYFNESEFSDQELANILKETEELKNKIASYVTEYRENDHFVTSYEQRNHTYMKYKECLHQKIKKYTEIVERLREKIKEKQEATRTVVFVTFRTFEQRQFVVQNNKNTLFYKAKRALQFWKDPDYFYVMKGDIICRDIIIERPPEPEDINWGNLGLTDCQKLARFCFTIFVSIVMIGISFVVVYALSTVQKNNQSRRFISILISLAISVINLLIIKVIQFTTLIERNYSMHNYQISIAIKSIIAQSMNSIFVPIMVNYYIKDENIFGVSGLAEDIFILGVASSFVGVVMKLIEPWNLFLGVRYKFYHDEERRLYLNQYELNEISEKMQFQIGLEYIYLITNFIFICFFVSLQPVLAIFGLVSVAIMYWIQKFSLLSRCQRPVPGPDNITSALYQLLFFGPVAYALGNLTWTWFISSTNFRGSLVPNLIALGLSLLMFIFPYDHFIDQEVVPQSKDYFQKRIFFTSEYDRLNPSTSNEAIAEYRQFLLDKKKEYQKLDPELSNQILQGFQNVSQKNIYKPTYMNRLNVNQQEEVVQQLLYNECRNVVNPFDILANVLPQRQIKSFIEENIHQTTQPYNPFNNLHAGKKLSKSDAVVVGPSMMNSIIQPEPSSKTLLREGLHLSIEQNIYNDQFKNMYRSNIRFDQNLGLTSRIVPQEIMKSHHRGPKNSL